MTADKIRSRINEVCTLFGFEYKGKDGNVDSYYSPELNKDSFLLCFNGDEQTVYDIEAVMTTPFIDGECLNDMFDKIEITEW